jgi:putative ubiquitin-RnfH superfamily antitoxin RatB of RatAB toxin-antitoxin module
MPEPAEATVGAVVVYALPGRVHWFATRLPAGSTIGEAIRASGILGAVPELAQGLPDVGVFGRCCGLDEPVREGDRIEIYRPLQVDPKEARRLRAGAQGD